MLNNTASIEYINNLHNKNLKKKLSSKKYNFYFLCQKTNVNYIIQ